MQIALVFFFLNYYCFVRLKRNQLRHFYQLHVSNVTKTQIQHMEGELIGVTLLPPSDCPQTDL